MRRDAVHRILFVESSPVLRHRLEQLALSHGWDAVGCEDIPAAVAAATTGPFDLVVTAAQLPSGNYRDVVSHLRELSELTSVPIVMLTGEDAASIQSVALGQGVTEIFSGADLDAFEQYLKDQGKATDELLGLKALVLDDDPSVCQFIVTVLQQMDLQADGYTRLEDAQEAAHHRGYRLVIADLILDRGLSGNKFIRTLRHSGGRSSDALIIAISAFQDPARRLDALRAGADLFLSKPFSQEELSTQVLRLLSRAPELAAPANTLPGSDGFHLSRRERMICAMVVSGQPDKHIAARLGISFWTVRTHMSRIFRKCGVNNRVELGNLLRGSSEGNGSASAPINPASLAQSAVIEWLSLASHVVDGLTQGILVVDADWKTIYTNPSFFRSSGYGGSELLGRKTHLITQAEADEAGFHALLTCLEKKGVWSGSIRYHHKDGVQKSGRLTIQRLPPGMPLQARYVLELMGQDG